MNDAEYQILLDKCLDGTATEAEHDTAIAAAEQAPERDAAMAEATAMDAALHALELDREAFATRAMQTVTASDAHDRFASGLRRRLERQQAAPAAARPAWARWITGLAALLLIGVGVLITAQWSRIGVDAAPRGALVRAVTGQVRLVHADRTVRPAAGTRVVAGSAIETGADGYVRVQYEDNTRLELTENTSILFERADGARKTLRLAKGGLLADVAPQKPQHPMTVSTPHAHIVVVGTRFRVLAGPHRTTVQNVTGTLQIVNRSSNEHRVLTAGSTAMIGHTTRIVSGAAGSGAGRVSDGLVALYTFREGKGTTVSDLAVFGTPLDLSIRDAAAVAWLPDGGLAVRAPARIASDRPARKIVEGCRASREFTIEAWVRPRLVEQYGPARIVSLAGGAGATRNFMLGIDSGDWPWKHAYVVRLRATEGAGTPGNPMSGPGTVTTRLTHVAFARDRVGTIRLMVNGEDANAATCRFADSRLQHTLTPVRQLPNLCSEWNDEFRLAIANEVGGERPWLGDLHLVAVYARALSQDEVRRNYAAGPPRRKARAAQSNSDS